MSNTGIPGNINPCLSNTRLSTEYCVKSPSTEYGSKPSYKIENLVNENCDVNHDRSPGCKPNVNYRRPNHGCLMWLSTSARPNISKCSVSCYETLFHAKSCSLETHPWYLGIHKRDQPVRYYVQRGLLPSKSLEAFADAEYGSKVTHRRSVSGGAVMNGEACVCWLPRAQKSETLLTSEAEYIALKDVVKGLLFLRQA